MNNTLEVDKILEYQQISHTVSHTKADTLNKFMQLFQQKRLRKNARNT